MPKDRPKRRICNPDIQSIGDVVKTAGEWERFEKVITTGPKFVRCQIYLYNTHPQAKSWYNDIDLREAE